MFAPAEGSRDLSLASSCSGGCWHTLFRSLPLSLPGHLIPCDQTSSLSGQDSCARIWPTWSLCATVWIQIQKSPCQVKSQHPSGRGQDTGHSGVSQDIIALRHKMLKYIGPKRGKNNVFKSLKIFLKIWSHVLPRLSSKDDLEL